MQDREDIEVRELRMQIFELKQVIKDMKDDRRK